MFSDQAVLVTLCDNKSERRGRSDSDKTETNWCAHVARGEGDAPKTTAEAPARTGAIGRSLSRPQALHSVTVRCHGKCENLLAHSLRILERVRDSNCLAFERVVFNIAAQSRLSPSVR